jgi:hypothetical protein
VTETIQDDERIAHISEKQLHEIVIIEFTKTLYTQEVDEENKEGYFLIYKSYKCHCYAIVNEINHKYPYAKRFNFDNCKRRFTSTFFKRTLVTITNLQ